MDTIRRKINHKECSGFHSKGFDGFPVVTFGRATYKRSPTDEERIRFDERRDIIENLGGVCYKNIMDTMPKNKVFSKEDCKNMVNAVKTSLKNYRVLKTWNGVGCLTFSVSVKRIKEESKK